jgi:hypothetical protein
MMVKSVFVVVTLWVTCLGYGMAGAAEDAAQAEKEKPSQEFELVPAPAEDLEAIQGVWSRTERVGLFGKQRMTKEIKGDTESVTIYTSSGEVSSAHTVKVELRRAGPIKVFMFKDQTFTAGPNQGQTMDATIGYVYKVVDDTFIEIWGILEEGDAEVRVLRWKRSPPEE